MRHVHLLALVSLFAGVGAITAAACSTSPNDTSDGGDTGSDTGSDADIIVDAGTDVTQADATSDATTADGGLTQWYPGHYIQLAAASIQPSEKTELTDVLANHIAPFVGVQIQYDWWKFGFSAEWGPHCATTRA